MRVLRMKQLAEKFGISEPECERRRRKDPHFPKPIRLGPSIVGYLESEADQYLMRYVAARDRELAEKGAA
jgi:predicted DNA-binding transcriptional regulator AlpA